MLQSTSRIRSSSACRHVCTSLLLLCVLLAHSDYAWAQERSTDLPPQNQAVDFDEHVAPILIDHCFDCHSGKERKGGLDLSNVEEALKGGETGQVIVAKDLKSSLLWQRILADEMPPKTPLTFKQKNVLKTWITSGAKWGTSPIDPFRVTTQKRAGYDWWALQPVQRPVVPKSRSDSQIRNPVDAFVQTKLEEYALSKSAAASPGALIRRLYFDLIGLPPDPKAVASFVAEMEADSESAVNQLIDQLLSSRHFGERWARHWLDVVRFGESQGFERDKIRLNSWYYRDWVINALNNDMPYDEFVRQQIAGDILYPNDPDATIATGFLVAGPWDEVGQGQRSAAMKAIVRQDEIEDYVGTIGQTFLGLTVNCARCHDHKFDPILQKEYYQLASAVGGVRHGDRNVSHPETKKRAKELSSQIKQIREQIQTLDSKVVRRFQKQRKISGTPLQRVSPIARWDFEYDLSDRIGNLHATQHPKAMVSKGRLILDGGNGYASTAPQNFALKEKTLEAWVKLTDLNQRAGAAISIHTKKDKFDAIVFAERQPGKWMAGSDFFLRTQNLDAPPESTAADEFTHFAISYHTDGTIACYRNGQPYGSPYTSSGPFTFQPGTWSVRFGLRTGRPAASRQLRGLLEAAQLYDKALTADEIAASFECEKAEITHDTILAALSLEEKHKRDALSRSLSELQAEQEEQQPFSVYAVSPRKPDTVHLLHRGNPSQKREVVAPGGVAAVGGMESSFGIAPDAPDDQRRRGLVDWVTNRNNGLFARVIVNRIWHYHFGTGLVATPNDFGFNGGLPSHPELLDWLASELIDSGWRMKHIHRLIVGSATWQQSSGFRPECARVDANNRMLWRKSPQRLEAEALRDSILKTSGQLNSKLGGAPYQDFTTHVHNSQFYTMTDPDNPDVYRRTIYRTWLRSGRSHLLDAFDCPDPSTTAPKRAITTTPIQSLALMNGSFVLRMANRFAERVKGEAGDDSRAQVTRAYWLAFGRSPDAAELNQGRTFVRDHGLPAMCRVMFNSNEFVYVD